MVVGGIYCLQEDYNFKEFDLVLVENVGNLVCLVEFEVGEYSKVVLFSVIEGEDKFLKYLVMFQEVDCLLIIKIDFIFYLDIDLEKLVVNVCFMNFYVIIILVLVKIGEGLDIWFSWVKS